MKKIIILILFLSVLAAIGLNVLYRKAPALLTSALQSTLHKKVVIESIAVSFPDAFELTGFRILENEPFKDEQAFSAQHIRLNVSLTDLWQRKLVIHKIEVENADIVIRRFNRKISSPLSEVAHESTGSGSSKQVSGGQSRAFSLVIDKFFIKNGHFEWIDYDVESSGFVVLVDQIEANIKNIALPSYGGKTSYKIEGRLIQGRDQKPTPLRLQGWTDLSSLDSRIKAEWEDVFLPYFKPYYSKVTPAEIMDGYFTARSALTIQQKNLKLSSEIEIINLLFGSYEGADQLFGLKAEEILGLLKDRAGKLRFTIEAEWNMADPSVRAKDVIRRSIELSLKQMALSNLGNFVTKALEKVGEKSVDEGKSKVEKVVDKVKDFLKY